ncbi:MAG: SDR family NAD(P)-dependent oxidoreductase, partial [Pseudomonas sagittaria]|nr:SDR family NAD(P)-dependent oxidoreductase [Pseudomonas sagittaria]
MNTPTHDGKRIWLTGASSGIGAALAEQLLQRGQRLALSARRREPLDALATRWPGQVLVLPGDLTDPVAVGAIAAQIDQAWGALDMAILNAGTCEYLDVRAFEAAMVERVVNSNLLAA